ncbi:hypothetical protein MNBD_NITROSPINAE03-772, partial [hydrothermal vent metagenome]
QDLVAGDKMVTVELTGLMSDWLINHIAEKDSRYGRFFNDRGVY